MNQNVKRTILWDLSRPALQQQPHSSSARFDELYCSGVGHVSCALPVDFNDLISYLLIKETSRQSKMVLFKLHFQQRSTHRRPVSREQKKGLVVARCFLVEAKSWLHPESDHQTLFIFVEIQMLDHEGCDDMPLIFNYDRGHN